MRDSLEVQSREKHSHKRERLTRWERLNRLSEKGSSRFLKLPSYFGTGLTTRILIALSCNGPAIKADLFRTVASNYGPITKALNRLQTMGVVASAPLSHGSVYFMNPIHPATDAIAHFAEQVAREFPPPVWSQRPVPPHATKSDALSFSAPCPLFGSEALSRLILFLFATGGANLAQMGEAIHGKQAVKNCVEQLQRLGIVHVFPPIVGGNTRFAILDPRFRYHIELRAIIVALLELHRDIEGLALAVPRLYPGRVGKGSRSGEF